MQITSMTLGTCSYAQIIQRWKARITVRNICVHTQNESISLISMYLLICANNPALEGQNPFRNSCVHMQITSITLGTCSYAQIIQRWKARIIFGIYAYVRRIDHVPGYLLVCANNPALEGQKHY